MTSTQIAFLAVVFVGTFGAAMFMLAWFAPNAARERLRRLAVDGGATVGRETGRWIERVVKVTSPFAKLSLPEDGWEKSGLRKRFMNAGIRSASAPIIYFGIKTLLAAVLPIAAYATVLLNGERLDFTNLLLVLLVAASIGYYLPNIVVSRLVFVRQREIFETFPDALDLMTVCVEAGLGVEAALNKVAEDIEHKSKVLGEELRLVGLELRAGSDRERALRNLAMRTGVEEVDTWASMLIQADRFGTSIAASLRVHSDMLRTRRRQRAEEAAAKIALKLLFPLIFCIFPSLMLVLMGPAFIQIYRVLLPTMTGGSAP
jgi:tight adherence protein C